MLRRQTKRAETQSPGPVYSPPPQGLRRTISLLIGGVLLLQVALPLRYYLRDEPTSERFAWRMFSTIHMTRWRCQVVETVRTADGLRRIPLPLDAMLEESAVLALHAGQLDYARRLLEYRLERPEVVKVEYQAAGVLPGGEVLPPLRLVLAGPGEQ